MLLLVDVALIHNQWVDDPKHVTQTLIDRGMIHEEDLTKEQNEFIDALEDADERMQKEDLS